MSINYDDRLTDDSDKMRFWLQDTVDDRGPKPAKKNFSDAEIDALITAEGSWQRAVAAGFEVLTSAWQSETTFSVQNGSYTRSDAANGYRKMAIEWRDKHGYAGDGATEEIGAKDVDFSGNDVSPLFQREAFGHKVTDWDPS